MPLWIVWVVSGYFEGLGIEATAHQLRHWFGTRTYAACRDIRVVQELLGHQDPATTATYTAFSDGEAAAAVAALPTPNAQTARPSP